MAVPIVHLKGLTNKVTAFSSTVASYFTTDRMLNVSSMTDGFLASVAVTMLPSMEEMCANGTTKLHYKIAVPVMMGLCLISTIINLRILATVFWIRRPMSPTLQISLSLAGADAYSSTGMGIGLFLNSWLPVIHCIHQTTNCPRLIIEAFRLGGIIMTVAHLLFLAGNHYLGIVRPLHYASILTRRNTNVTLFFVWTLPIAFFFVYFGTIENDGFRVEKCGYEFLRKRHFRMIFSSLFFGPLLLMFIIYTHIFIIVKRHHNTRLQFSRTGSVVQNRRNVNTGISGSRAQEQQLDRNVKALWTTLFILGSYIVGWIPGIIHFLLVCDDCMFPLDYFEPTTTFFICILTNSFIIMKTIMNPVIYAARMAEIKIATMKMNLATKRLFSRRGASQDDDPWNATSQQSERHLQPLTTSARYRFNQARNDQTVAITVNNEWQEDEEWSGNRQPATKALMNSSSAGASKNSQADL